MLSPGVVPDASVRAGPLGIAELGRLTLWGAVPDAASGGAASLPHPLDARREAPSVTTTAVPGVTQCPLGAGSPG